MLKGPIRVSGRVPSKQHDLSIVRRVEGSGWHPKVGSNTPGGPQLADEVANEPSRALSLLEERPDEFGIVPPVEFAAVYYSRA
jgi:hypothetical protein